MNTKHAENIHRRTHQGARVLTSVMQKALESEVCLPEEEIARVNKLLAPHRGLTPAGARLNYIEGIFITYFADGSRLSYDLCSTTNGFYDDVVWHSADGSTDITLECAFELGDIEFEAEGNEYRVIVIAD